MLITTIIMLALSFGAGYATRKTLALKQPHYPEPPLLDTPEHILNYLEACTLSQDNENSFRLLNNFRDYTAQKQLPAATEEGTIDLRDLRKLEEKKPDWFHDPNAKIPQDKHWELFFTDLKREQDPDAKIGVVKHWMNGLRNNFSFKEMEMILNEFDDSKDRAEVRKIYAGKRNPKKKK